MKVSVIMPVFNASKYLGASIDSILNQTYKNFEFIIINDGSTDNSKEIIETKMKYDSRIKIINQKNLGITIALINGISHSCGEVIARMDADDLSFPDRFKLQIKEIDRGFDLCCSRTFWEHKNRPSNIFYSIIPPKILLRYTNPFIHGTYMFKKTMYEYLGGYNKDYTFSQDFFFMKKVIKHKFKIKYLKRILYKSRSLNDSITFKNKNIQKTLPKIYRNL